MNSVELTKKLIGFRALTGSKECTEVLDFVKEYLTDFDYEEFESKGTKSILFFDKSKVTKDKNFKVILNAHLDVVAAKDEQFEAKEENNKIIGRGAYDMLGGAAVEIEVFKNLAKEVNFAIGLQLVTDEETGGFNGTKYQLDQGVRAEFAIVGEPTNLKIKNRAKGIIWLKVKAIGTSAHAAYPWNGKNANSKLLDFLKKLEQLVPNPEKENWSTTMNIAELKSSNEAFNKIADRAEAKVDIRYIPEDSKLLDKIKELAQENEIKVEVVTYEPSHFTDLEDGFLKSLETATSEVTNEKDLIIYGHGGSDMRFFTALDIPSVEFGPSGAGHHSDDEWVEIESINRYEQILKKLLTTL